MVIKKVDVAAGQAFDFRQRRIDRLRVEMPTLAKERLHITEIALVGTPSRHDDGVGHDVKAALDQITPNRRKAHQRAHLRPVNSRRFAVAEVFEELRPGVFAGPQKKGVRMKRGFLRQRSHMKTSQAYVRTALAIKIGDLIGTPGGSNVDLNDDEIRHVIETK